MDFEYLISVCCWILKCVCVGRGMMHWAASTAGEAVVVCASVLRVCVCGGDTMMIMMMWRKARENRITLLSGERGKYAHT